MVSKAGKATTAGNLILSAWEKPHESNTPVGKSRVPANDALEAKRFKRMLAANATKDKKKKAELQEAEKPHNLIKEQIRDAMTKISARAAFMDQPLHIRMKKERMLQAGPGKKIDLDRLEREISDTLKAKSGAAFKTLSRDAYFKVTSLRPQGPPPGVYRPGYDAVDVKSDAVVPFARQVKRSAFDPQAPDNAGRQRKYSLACKKMSLCPHAVRLLDDFVFHKRAASVVKRPRTTLDAATIGTRSQAASSLQGSPEPRMVSRTLGIESPAPRLNTSVFSSRAH